MYSIKDSIIDNFNVLVKSIKKVEKDFPEQEHFITFVSFNSNGIKFHLFNEPVKKLKRINSKNYLPDNNTPLYDAMGISINKLKDYLNDKSNYNVLVTIPTKGLENSSIYYSNSEIKKLVEKLSKNRWTFTYIGTEHLVEEAAQALSINNYVQFKKTAQGINDMMDNEIKARYRYSYMLRNNYDTSTDFYNLKNVFVEKLEK